LTALYIALFAVGVSAFLWFLGREISAGILEDRASREFAAIHSARPAICDEEFCAAEFSPAEAAENIPGRIRRILAESTGYAPEKLRADDDFWFEFVEGDVVQLVRDLEEAFGITITDEDLMRPDVCTVRGLVRIVREKSASTTQPSHRVP